VTDRRTDRQTPAPHDGKDRTTQSVARVKNSYCGPVLYKVIQSPPICSGLSDVSLPIFGMQVIDNFIYRKQTIEHTTNQIKLNNNYYKEKKMIR